MTNSGTPASRATSQAHSSAAAVRPSGRERSRSTGNRRESAPVYPWIYTGGIDPFLWQPIPGVETLDFVPYRVDLTPFASILSNGSQHTVSVSVVNSDYGFSTTGNLLLYLDHGSTQVTGALVSDSTSALPSQNIINNVKFSNGNANGPLTTDGSHSVAVDGYVDTSQGRIETRITQSISFANTSQFAITFPNGGLSDIQDINQDTKITSNTNIISSNAGQGFVRQSQEWPLTLDIDFAQDSSGNITQTTSVDQSKEVRTLSHLGPGQTSSSNLTDEVKSADTLDIPANGPFSNSGAKSSQRYFLVGSNGLCYNKTITSLNNILTSTMQGCDKLGNQ